MATCTCHACYFSSMLGTPTNNLLAIDKRLSHKATTPTRSDMQTFQQSYMFVYQYMLQNVHVFGGQTLALALRTFAILFEARPQAFPLPLSVVTAAEEAVPFAFARGMDTESVCAMWTFVSVMWKHRRSARLADYIAKAFMYVPMQAITEAHLECVLRGMSRITIAWPKEFLERMEELCVVRIRKMEQRMLTRIILCVGEVVARKAWKPTLLVSLLSSGNGFIRVSELPSEAVRDVALGLYHMHDLMSTWDLFKVYSRLEHRMVRLAEASGNEATTATHMKDVMSLFGKCNYSPSNQFTEQVAAV